MESPIFDFLHQPDFTYSCHKEDLEIPSLDNDDFNWIEDCILDSILPSANLDFLSDELLNENKDYNLGSDLENAKDDFNRVLEQWKLHLGELQGLDSIATESDLACELPHNSSNVIDVPVKDASVSDCGAHDGVIPLEQSPVLEALDVDSLLEQFEASETHSSSQEKGNTDPCLSFVGITNCNQRNCDENVAPIATEQPTDVKDSNISNSNNANNFSTPSRETSLHKLPIAQLPRFSIILKRDPVSSHHESNNQEILREHDYCSSPKLTVLPCANNTLTCDQSFSSSSFVSVTSKKMKSVLKPVSSPKSDDCTEEETLYSKLPDYYTSVVPHQSTQDNSSVTFNGTTSPKEPSCKENENENYYDRLPLYLTTFVNTTCGSDSTKLTRTSGKVKADDAKNARFYNVIEKDKTILPAIAKLNIRKNVVALQECKKARKDGEEMQSRKQCCSPQQKYVTSRSLSTSRGSPTMKWQSRTPHLSREQNIRPTSSLSPSHCSSSRSQSRSRSRSSERSSSLSSSSSSSNGSDRRCHSRAVTRTPKRHFQSKNLHQISHKRTHSYENSRWQYKQCRDEEQKKQIEDRRVVHVGNIKPGTSRADLHHRFDIFGPIEDITIHYREHGDCFGFITFVYTVDAFEALEHGNDDGFDPKYELSLGGRRLFCLEQYSDLDSLNNNYRMCEPSVRHTESFNFDELLKKAKDNLKKMPH